MNEKLKQRLIKAGAGGAVAIAACLAAFHEGEVKNKEGQHAVYLDPVGIPTACRGMTGPNIKMGQTYTDDECLVMERPALEQAERDAQRTLKYWSYYSKWRQAALIDFVFNAGSGALASSTMAKKFNAGDEVGGCLELNKWIKGRVKGELVTLNGLVTRRADETDLCLNWKAVP